MSAAPKLYEPDVSCPKCGKPPRIRMTARHIAKWSHDPPNELVQTYQCAFEFQPGRKCNTIYAITAGDVQRATEMQR